ncbi:hypothetical protein [Furfurilactobacillus curtus]|uniref:Uncharacterized protein n=1 Tax=Furfurilactobacillus curtus TaxID=1746200 RepID=A0ABQ5JKG3_9LACO
MYRIDVTEYPSGENPHESIDIESIEKFQSLINKINKEFGKNRVDVSDVTNGISTGDREFYEVDLMRRTGKHLYDMCVHYEYIKDSGIMAILQGTRD